jgi:hypothetical protein
MVGDELKLRSLIRESLSCTGELGEEINHTMKANPKKKYSPTSNRLLNPSLGNRK